MAPDKTAPLLATSEETGSLGILHVKRLWSRTLAKRLNQVHEPIPTEDWVKDNTLICGLGLGLRETMQYLSDRLPSLDEFERWILEKNGGEIETRRIERLNRALAGELKTGPPPDAHDLVFTPDEISFWEENGYIVLHDAV